MKILSLTISFFFPYENRFDDGGDIVVFAHGGEDRRGG